MSCLFDSLNKFAKESSAQELRQKICNFLSDNNKLMDDLTSEQVIDFESNIPLERYVSLMRQPCTMGGATEIKAFCIMYKLNVKVRSIPNGKEIDFIYHKKSPFVGLVWTGGHFDPM